MNEEAILEAARKAIADGESPDDVARWIEESTGVSLVEMAKKASGFAGDGAGRSWEQERLIPLDGREFGLKPGMSAREFGDLTAGPLSMMVGAQGLKGAVGAIRAARGEAAVMKPEVPRSALDALRGLVKPALRVADRALPWAGMGYLLKGQGGNR
jgi:hypothetical protein